MYQFLYIDLHCFSGKLLGDRSSVYVARTDRYEGLIRRVGGKDRMVAIQTVIFL